MDLDAYFERIGLQGRPGLAEVHRAHVTSIPFENLDPHGGKAVSLEPGDLEAKMVTGRRGGYCFEQNLLLAEAYRELGAEVDLMLARVLYRVEPGVVRPRSHLVLRITHAGESWLADVGFGNGTLLEPLPFHPGAEAMQAGWSMRLIATDDQLVLQRVEDGEWLDVYGFPAEPVPRIDVEVSNWFVCTHPRSPFVTGLMVTTHEASGRRLVLSDWGELALVERTPQSTHSTPVARRDIPGLLSEHFGLPGFVVGEDERIVAAAGD
jgi:N-hydroxyarylamine O-acetyltransferase